MAKVKGIFLTFSGFFLVMLIVTLSLLFATTLQQSNTRLMESGSLERVYALDTSLERVISNIDNEIDYELYWNNATLSFDLSITEILDSNFEDYGSDFYSNFLDLVSFVESDQLEIMFYPSIIYNSEEKLPLLIKPHNFKYTHLDQGENILTVYPGTYVPYVEWSLVLPSDDLGSGIQWTTQSPGDDMSFVLYVEDKDGDTDRFEQNISINSTNVFMVNGIEIKIGELCSQCMELDRNSKEVISTFNTKFTSSPDMPTLNYPTGLYVLDFEELGIYLNSTPRIL
jgi:hypothetical protein